MGQDDLVDEAFLGGNKGIGEIVFVIGHAGGDFLGVVKLGAVQDFDGTFGPHHRDLGGGPCVVEIALQMFRRHHNIGAAIGFAGDDGDFRHGRLTIGIKQFRAVFDDACIFLTDTRQEARHVDQCQDRDLEGVAKAHKPRGFARAVDIETACKHHRLVGHDADRLAFKADKAGEDVLGEILLDLVEIALVGDLGDEFLHVIRRVWVSRHQRIKAVFHAGRIVEERAHGGFLAVVERQEIDQTAGLGQRFDIVLERRIGDGALLRVGRGTAKLFSRDDLIGDGFNHIGAGDEHVRAVFDHEDKVSHRGAVDRPTRARPHDQTDLRDDARGHDIALKHLAISRQRGHALLNTRAAGIVDADDGRAVLHRHIHDLADLLAMGFGHRAAHHGEILTEHINLTAIDCAPAGDHAIACWAVFLHLEIGAAMGDEHVEFLETALIKQQLNALACGQFAFGVLRINAALASAQSGIASAGFEFG